MNWTTAQREAIETRGRRVLVSAGAGSGKTRVLVERFLSLLEENIDWRVADVVAVTFTEKAAREMVSRIRREIRSRIEASTNASERRRWREHRNALDSSRIGTIHALCASILRAHPAEAGLDPAFEVIEEIEAATLLDAALDEVLFDTARHLTAEAEVFSHLTTYQVREAIRSLVAQGERAYSCVSKFAESGASEILAFWRTTIAEHRIVAANNLLAREDWRTAVEIVLTLSALDVKDKREACRAQVADLLSLIDKREGEAKAAALLDIATAINLRGGSKKNWASEEEFEAVAGALKLLRELIRKEEFLTLELNEKDDRAAVISLHLSQLYKKVRHRFAQLKADRAALDFNDLEEITERMLATHKEVGDLYKHGERIRALMIDEFQDTSPIQKSILWHIAPASHELFIIGDAKQSIYRFRGADVKVFQDARFEIEANAGSLIGMDTCFRAHTRLIDFVNHTFKQILNKVSRYDMDYEAMNAAREAVQENAAIEIHLIEQDPDAETKLSTGELRELEARLIARRIREIVERNTVLVCDDRLMSRNADYGDFALLFQASTNFEIYEQALADAGIPYVTTAGRGFYARQEITDLSNLLAFLSNPLDDLSLAAALRSPMFALSDETLLRLRRVESTLWTALEDESIEIADNQRESVSFARETLKSLGLLVGRVSPAELITAMVRKTGYLATLMALPHGERRVANVEKLIEQTRSLATLTLLEVVERIKELKFREAREGEAMIEETSAVKIMTVHKSKGLEFPIVWIVDATYGGNTDKSIIASHPELGVAINLRDDEPPFDKSAPAAAFRLIKLLERQMDNAEKKRLLYVAATRAREHLIISGALGRAKLSGEHWLGHITQALGLEEDDRFAYVEYQGGGVDFHWHQAHAMNDSIVVEQSKMQSSKRGSSGGVNGVDLAFPLLRRVS
jgi:ATP-dependent helicase/nuclease subunit A